MISELAAVLTLVVIAGAAVSLIGAMLCAPRCSRCGSRNTVTKTVTEWAGGAKRCEYTVLRCAECDGEVRE